MSHGYDVFDTGHDRWQPTLRQINPEECSSVMAALHCLRLGDEQGLLVLRHATGRRISEIQDLYDVELPRVLEYLRTASSRR